MDIELIRKLVLGTLILLLIIILYKRLLRFMQGKQPSDLYATFREDGIHRDPEGNTHIAIELPKKEVVELIIEDNDGKPLQTLLSGENPPQHYDFVLKKGEMLAGKYCCVLKSGNQRSVRYFWIK